MFIWFMKKIATDTSGEEIRRITTLLEENNFKYRLRTIQERGSVGSAMDARSYAQANIALYKGTSRPAVVYMVYVKRKDYDRAFDLLF